MSQWTEKGILHSQATYLFPDGRKIEERNTFEQKPQFRQLTFRWRETRGKQVTRQYEVDFTSKTAKGMKLEKNEKKTWNEHFDDLKTEIAFAGSGFVLAVLNLQDRLSNGEKIKLQAVAMTPKPRLSDVEVYREKEETVSIGERKIQSDKIVIHPDVNIFARVAVDPPDNVIWLYDGKPSVFLRFEGPMMELSDPTVRIEVSSSRAAKTNSG